MLFKVDPEKCQKSRGVYHRVGLDRAIVFVLNNTQVSTVSCYYSHNFNDQQTFAVVKLRDTCVLIYGTDNQLF